MSDRATPYGPDPMAGHVKTRAVPSRPATNQRTRKAHERNRKRYAAILAEATALGAGSRPARAEEVLREAFARSVAHLRFAASQVDELDPEELWVVKYDAQGNRLVEPHKWYQLEQWCREEVMSFAVKMVELGLAERMVRIEEAQAEVIASAIKAAVRDLDLPPDKVRQIGPAIRRHLTLVEEQTA